MDTFIPAIMDIEASGFGPESYPIEVGVVFANGEKFCSLIRPEAHWTHWCKKAESLHRIRRRILFSAGISTHQMATTLNQRLDGMTVYSDCWMVDKPWLDLLFDVSGLTPTFRLRALEMILDEHQWNTWQSIHSEVVSSDPEKRHRASKDAELIQKTWVTTKLRRAQPKKQHM